MTALPADDIADPERDISRGPGDSQKMMRTVHREERKTLRRDLKSQVIHILMTI